MRKDVLLGIIIVVAILAALTYLSMQLRAHTCRACVTFNGLTNCATASGTTHLVVDPPPGRTEIQIHPYKSPLPPGVQRPPARPCYAS